jgi:hypothetical protein
MPSQTERASTLATIEAGTPDDLAGVGRVAYASSLFGASATLIFPSAALFTELWVAPS